MLVARRGGVIVVELNRRKETKEMKEASSDKKTRKDGRMTFDQDLPYAEEDVLVPPNVECHSKLYLCMFSIHIHHLESHLQSCHRIYVFTIHVFGSR